MTKLLLLDKDLTIVKSKIDRQFVRAPWDQTPMPNVSETLARYAADGWDMAICSNQGGIAANHKSLEEAIQEMQFCLELFPQIAEAYFCPDFEGEICWRVWGRYDEQHRICYHPLSSQIIDLGLLGAFRKPNPGMLRLAIDIHNASEVIFVGDRDEDQGAALAAGISFRWAAEFFGGEFNG